MVMINYDIIIEFFKKMNLYDDQLFKEIKSKTTIINGDYEEIKEFIAFYPKYKDGKLEDYKLYLPSLTNFNSILIYIHEYGHALFPEDELEIFPNLLEALFIKQYLNDASIQKYIEKIEKKLKQNIDINHEIGNKIKIKILQDKR